MGRAKQARRRRRDRTRSLATELGSPDRRADVVVVLIHGIGNQRAGSLLTNMAEPCVRVLACLANALGYRVEKTVELVSEGSHASDAPRTTTLTFVRRNARRRVVFVEAVWSRCFARPSWWRCLAWAVRSLPALVLLLAPDQRDAEELVHHDAKTVAPRRLRERLGEALRLGYSVDRSDFVSIRFAVRLLVAWLLLGVPIAAVAAQPVIGIVVAACLVWYLRSRHNVVGHVVVAASEPAELAKIRQRVGSCLEWARAHGQRVVVIGHSQGGYLAHDALAHQPARQPVTALIGVGSGLKPIWLLRQLNRGKVLAAAWVTLTTAVMVEVLLWPLVAALGRGIGSTTRSLLETAGEMALPIGAAHELTPDDLSDMPSWESTWDAIKFAVGPPSPLRLVVLAIALGMFFVGRRLWKAAYPERRNVGVAAVSARTWLELSSYHDPVGRLLLPTLPQPAVERAVPVGGHPLRDHVTYFAEGSLVPWRIANVILGALGEAPLLGVDGAEAALNARAQRRRVLRFELLAALLFVVTLPLVLTGTTLIVAIWHAGAVWLVAALVLSVLFSWREADANGRVLRRLADAVAAMRPTLDIRLPVPRDKRLAPALILLALTVVAFAVTIQLVGYPVAGAESPAAFADFTALFFAYFVLVGAGYRPTPWIVVPLVGLLTAVHMASVPAVPHPSAMPDWLAVPGGTALVAFAVASVFLLILLRRRRLADVAVLNLTTVHGRSAAAD